MLGSLLCSLGEHLKISTNNLHLCFYFNPRGVCRPFKLRHTITLRHLVHSTWVKLLESVEDIHLYFEDTESDPLIKARIVDSDIVRVLETLAELTYQAYRRHFGGLDFVSTFESEVVAFYLRVQILLKCIFECYRFASQLIAESGAVVDDDSYWRTWNFGELQTDTLPGSILFVRFPVLATRR